MTDLQFDSDAVGSTGSTLQSTAWAMSLDVDLALGACGSSAVSAAADTWAMWAKGTLLQLQSMTAGAGVVARDAATAFETQEAEITSAANGGTP
ncbi:hypothetical protein [Microbacterium paraoxydans]|uniref:Excreted virulence factor EspC, type VII ESX diderm n=1 Tax=Microbacterium paraoxydans TaxID=199592 RepID=A0ABS5IJ71_9MICO|nr:hypothetical protein [Microbacterium paraoxydans]MBS0022995.1 hypothetical protein [Microbacterium paraoxydans]